MLNKNNLIKYLILFIIVSVSTYCIPNCCIINQHAIYIGLIAGTTFILLDKTFPNVVIHKGMDEKEEEDYNIKHSE